MRGKPRALCAVGLCVGITPACAGKTDFLQRGQRKLQDHPRVCGENLLRPTPTPRLPGSPPRVRGKRKEMRVEPGDVRITPACAGKTASPRRSPAAVKDHPRVCGENFLERLSESRSRGSPPRVRGKLYLLKGEKNMNRITPACAGKTAHERCRISNAEDHPRVCGENRPRIKRWFFTRGSPPRVRGKPGKKSRDSRRLRITPACAGKTGINAARSDKHWDHPRVCGENPSRISWLP